MSDAAKKAAHLTLSEARNTLADSDVRDRLAQLGRNYDGGGFEFLDGQPNPRLVEYEELKRVPEAALVAKLRSGELEAVGQSPDAALSFDAPMREIDASYWTLFEPDFGRSALVDEVGKVRIIDVRVLYRRVTLSGDGRSLSVDGRIFEVGGPKQMQCVRFLFDAYSEGRDWSHKKDILSHADSKSLELREIFKSNKNWDEFIFGNGKSEYTIDPDLRPAAPRSPKS